MLVQIGVGPFANRFRDFLHLGRALRRLNDLADEHIGVGQTGQCHDDVHTQEDLLGQVVFVARERLEQRDRMRFGRRGAGVIDRHFAARRVGRCRIGLCIFDGRRVVLCQSRLGIGRIGFATNKPPPENRQQQRLEPRLEARFMISLTYIFRVSSINMISRRVA